jgi:hypothetical protein
MESILSAAQLLSALSCALFAGAAIYITFVEHPARLECGTELAATVFPVSYRKAAVMQASLAAVGLLSSIVAWLFGAGGWWLAGGLLLGSVIPFTLVIIMPTNKLLLDPVLEKGSAQAQALLLRWGRLHAVRSILSVSALVIFLVSA